MADAYRDNATWHAVRQETATAEYANLIINANCAAITYSELTAAMTQPANGARDAVVDYGTSKVATDAH